MGQGIISRSNPGNSGDKVGDIRITTRNTLGEKWALCNGSIMPGGGIKANPLDESKWKDADIDPEVYQGANLSPDLTFLGYRPGAGDSCYIIYTDTTSTEGEIYIQVVLCTINSTGSAEYKDYEMIAHSLDEAAYADTLYIHNFCIDPDTSKLMFGYTVSSSHDSDIFLAVYDLNSGNMLRSKTITDYSGSFTDGELQIDAITKSVCCLTFCHNSMYYYSNKYYDNNLNLIIEGYNGYSSWYGRAPLCADYMNNTIRALAEGIVYDTDVGYEIVFNFYYNNGILINMSDENTFGVLYKKYVIHKIDGDDAIYITDLENNNSHCLITDIDTTDTSLRQVNIENGIYDFYAIAGQRLFVDNNSNKVIFVMRITFYKSSGTGDSYKYKYYYIEFDSNENNIMQFPTIDNIPIQFDMLNDNSLETGDYTNSSFYFRARGKNELCMETLPTISVDDESYCFIKIKD